MGGLGSVARGGGAGVAASCSVSSYASLKSFASLAAVIRARRYASSVRASSLELAAWRAPIERGGR